MKNILFAFTFAALLTGCCTAPRHPASVTLEMRPGSQAPGPGLVEMVVPGAERPVYVSDEVVITNADIESTRVKSGPNGPQIELVFTKTGVTRFAEVTEHNIRNPLAILIDGQLISAPVVMEKIIGGKAVITGSFSEEEAQRIAKGISAP